MKRYKYNVNQSWYGVGFFYEQQPLLYLDVAPGETVGGTVETFIQTPTTNRLIRNRVYLDQHAFYVPYRLLWNGFPDFIAGVDGAGSVPTVVDAFAENFEPTAFEHTAWKRYAFNLIWNQYFRRKHIAERALTDTTTCTWPMRPSTLEQRLQFNSSIEDTTIPLDATAETINVDDLRAGFAQDRWNKTRDYYGDKYVDYLAALGVQTSWSILDEPELLGSNHQEIAFAPTSVTTLTDESEPASDNLTNPGATAGKWFGTAKIQIPKTFCPEHGMIVVMSAVKMELVLQAAYTQMIHKKTDRNSYYSPEFETERIQHFNPQDDAATEFDPLAPRFEDYRYGQNQSMLVQNWPDPTYVVYNATLGDLDSWQYPSGALLSDIWAPGQTSPGGSAVYSFNSRHRLQRLSPVRPPQRLHGVS